MVHGHSLIAEGALLSEYPQGEINLKKSISHMDAYKLKRVVSGVHQVSWPWHKRLSQVLYEAVLERVGVDKI